jgi:hypothetical protein
MSHQIKNMQTPLLHHFVVNCIYFTTSLDNCIDKNENL